MTTGGPQCDVSAHVTPRSSRNKVEILPDGSLRVWLTAPPTDGQANQAACRLLAERLGLAKTAVSVAAGAKSRHKRLHIEGLCADEATKRLAGK